MKKEIFQEIEIPEGVDVEIKDNEINVKGREGELTRIFNINKLVFEKKDNKIIIGNKKITKNEKRMMNTIVSHIKNMIKGVQEKFEYELKIVFSHFPMNVNIKNNVATIKNFLGEKIPRIAKIPEGVDIILNKDLIKVTSINKELAGQAAANFETATKVRMRDRRVFQDGIFMINKAGKKI